MNIEGFKTNPAEPPGPGLSPGPRRDIRSQYPHREQRTITQEELREWNNCVNESIYKAGIPFALGVQIISSVIKGTKQTLPAQPQPPIPPAYKLAKNCALFVGNVLLGVFLYSPVCYKRLQAKVLAGQQRIIKEKEDGIIASKTEGTILQADDSDFRSNLNFDERDTSFSSLNLDFETTYDKPILEEETGKQKYRPKTTYEELRKRNREEGLKTYSSPSATVPTAPPPPPPSVPPPLPPSSSEDIGFRSFSEPLVESPPVVQTPTRPKRKNKYGDEIDF